MVYGIVKQNLGGIECQSDPGKGTTFTIYLPCYQDVDDEPAAETLKPEEHGGKRNETILIVDDEPNVLNVCKFAIENEGYEVLAASSPMEAISIASEYPGQIHLLLTDVVMPDMNGADLANKLESMVPGLKTIFMSGYATDIVTRRGVVDEGVNFVQKPFTMADLVKIVRQMLDTDSF